jgi:TetR/AcrR family transcriptional repressor of nem operon
LYCEQALPLVIHSLSRNRETYAYDRYQPAAADAARLSEMPRVTRAVAEQHRHQVISVASRLFAEHGIDGVSLQRIAGEAGFTHGFFAKHFASKDELIAAAIERAFDKALQRTDYGCVTNSEGDRAGCPVITFAVSAFHASSDSSVRHAFMTGLARVVNSAEDTGGRRDQLLTALASCVGAALITQAAGGDPKVAEVLDAVQITSRRSTA